MLNVNGQCAAGSVYIPLYVYLVSSIDVFNYRISVGYSIREFFFSSWYMLLFYGSSFHWICWIIVSYRNTVTTWPGERAYHVWRPVYLW